MLALVSVRLRKESFQVRQKEVDEDEQVENHGGDSAVKERGWMIRSEATLESILTRARRVNLDVQRRGDGLW